MATPPARSEKLRSQHVQEFQDAFISELLFEKDSITAADLPFLTRPFLWWNDIADTFDEIEHEMRGVMARLGGLLQLHLGTDDSFHYGLVAAGVAFIDGYVNRREVTVPDTTNPLNALRDACYGAKKLLEAQPGSILDRVAPMKDFHEGWRNILSDELIDLSDEAAFDRLTETCGALGVAENAVYNIVRARGVDLLASIEALIPTLLPSDQLLWLHGLDAFPRNAQVLAFYDRALAAAPSDFNRSQIETYRQRVADGVETTGYEL